MPAFGILRRTRLAKAPRALKEPECLQHALRNASASMTSIKVHASKLRAVLAAAVDAKRTDNLFVGLDDPKSVPLGFREDILQLPQLSVDRGRNVLLERLVHIRRRQFAIDARPKRGNWIIVC
jgi:hypothetical protein